MSPSARTRLSSDTSIASTCGFAACIPAVCFAMLSAISVASIEAAGGTPGDGQRHQSHAQPDLRLVLVIGNTFPMPSCVSFVPNDQLRAVRLGSAAQSERFG